MTALEFIHKHQNDEDNGECLILPDGSVEEPLPSHIGRLVELTGILYPGSQQLPRRIYTGNDPERALRPRSIRKKTFRYV